MMAKRKPGGGDITWMEAAQDREGWRDFVAVARGLHGVSE